ncbi:8765_t:CDS:2 [Ambispora leptoticha]|uniref:8765_t:CDS:1 n=1 Tax=Ambispora leptoticha TaxID=144679 RepID=A0A9N8WCX6_9GLOM|nr:8765_t:CDS:2 [Ambispora leptoticha]
MCNREADAVEVTKTVLMAVAYLHANHIVHRDHLLLDLKPENLLYKNRAPDSALVLGRTAKVMKDDDDILTTYCWLRRVRYYANHGPIFGGSFDLDLYGTSFNTSNNN